MATFRIENPPHDFRALEDFRHRDDTWLGGQINTLFEDMINTNLKNPSFGQWFRTHDVVAGVDRLTLNVTPLVIGLGNNRFHYICRAILPLGYSDDHSYQRDVIEFGRQNMSHVAPGAAPRLISTVKYTISGKNGEFGLAFTMDGDYRKLAEGVEAFTLNLTYIIGQAAQHAAYLAAAALLKNSAPDIVKQVRAKKTPSELDAALKREVISFACAHKSVFGVSKAIEDANRDLYKENSMPTTCVFFPMNKRTVITSNPQYVQYDKAGPAGPQLFSDFNSNEYITSLHGTPLREWPQHFASNGKEQSTAQYRIGNFTALYVFRDQRPTDVYWRVFDAYTNDLETLDPNSCLTAVPYMQTLRSAEFQDPVANERYIASLKFNILSALREVMENSYVSGSWGPIDQGALGRFKTAVIGGLTRIGNGTGLARNTDEWDFNEINVQFTNLCNALVWDDGRIAASNDNIEELAGIEYTTGGALQATAFLRPGVRMSHQEQLEYGEGVLRTIGQWGEVEVPPQLPNAAPAGLDADAVNLRFRGLTSGLLMMRTFKTVYENYPGLNRLAVQQGPIGAQLMADLGVNAQRFTRIAHASLDEVDALNEPIFFCDFASFYADAKLTNDPKLIDMTMSDCPYTHRTRNTSFHPRREMCGAFTPSSFLARYHFLFVRPLETGYTETAVAVIGGSETGVTVLSDPVVTHSEDGATKQILFAYFQRFGAWIFQKRRIAHIRHMFYAGMVCGSNTTFITTEYMKHLKDERFTGMEMESPSAFCWFVPAGQIRKGMYIDIEGKVDGNGFNGTSSGNDFAHSKFWYQFCGFNGTSGAFVQPDSSRSAVAKFCFQTYVTYKDVEGHDGCITGKGHHGDNERPNTAHVRMDGDSLYPAVMQIALRG